VQTPKQDDSCPPLNLNNLDAYFDYIEGKASTVKVDSFSPTPEQIALVDKILELKGLTSNDEFPKDKLLQLCTLLQKCDRLASAQLKRKDEFNDMLAWHRGQAILLKFTLESVVEKLRNFNFGTGHSMDNLANLYELMKAFDYFKNLTENSGNTTFESVISELEPKIADYMLSTYPLNDDRNSIIESLSYDDANIFEVIVQKLNSIRDYPQEKQTKFIKLKEYIGKVHGIKASKLYTWSAVRSELWGHFSPARSQLVLHPPVYMSI